MNLLTLRRRKPSNTVLAPNEKCEDKICNDKYLEDFHGKSN